MATAAAVGVAAVEAVTAAAATDQATGGNVARNVVNNVSTTTLYHGGKLNNGTIQATKISLTDSIEHAQQYVRVNGGQVWKFQVPTRWLTQQQYGPVKTYTDQYIGTTSNALEYRFYGDAAGTLNQFLSK